MRFSARLTRGTRRAVVLAFLIGVLVLTTGAFARASGAGGTRVATPSASVGYPMAEADQAWAYQRFLVSSQADMSRLNQMGVDLGESLDKNPDGTMWAYAVVTATQRDYLARLGFRPGSIVQTSVDAANAQAEMAATSRKEMRALRLAKSKTRALQKTAAGETL